MTTRMRDIAEDIRKLPRGYRMRPAVMEDAEAAVELINAYMQALIGADETTVEALRHEWETPDFDVSRGVRLIESPDGEIVGFGDFYDTSAPYVRFVTWTAVHSDHEGSGLREALVEWGLDSARKSVSKAPEGARVTVVSMAAGVDRAAAETYESAGMSLIRYFNELQIVLDGPPPAPEWPEGITVRTMNRATDEEAFIHALDAGFEDHWGHVEQPFEQVMEYWQHVFDSYPGFEESLAFIAMDGDEIAGVSLCMKESEFDTDLGWVDRFAVLRPWRKRGLGLALLQHSFAELYQRGKEKVGLGVDASSLTGATRLYEKAGMHPINQFVLYEMELRPGVDLSLQDLEANAEEGKTS